MLCKRTIVSSSVLLRILNRWDLGLVGEGGMDLGGKSVLIFDYVAKDYCKARERRLEQGSW